MRITKWICDRCGCEYSMAKATEPQFYLERNLYDDDTESMDLCPQCADKLASWVARGKSEGALHQKMMCKED